MAFGAAAAAVPVIVQGGRKAFDIGREASTQSKKISIEYFGYDFVGLGYKLGFLYGIAFIIVKYFEALAFGTGILAFLTRPQREQEAGLPPLPGQFDLFGVRFGVLVPGINSFFGIGKAEEEVAKNALPETEEEKNAKLFRVLNEGFYGFKFWDIVNFLALIAVILELHLYHRNNSMLGGRGSPFTYIIFIMVIGAIVFVTIPKLQKIIKQVASEKKKDFNLEVSGGF